MKKYIYATLTLLFASSFIFAQADIVTPELQKESIEFDVKQSTEENLDHPKHGHKHADGHKHHKHNNKGHKKGKYNDHKEMKAQLEKIEQDEQLSEVEKKAKKKALLSEMKAKNKAQRDVNKEAFKAKRDAFRTAVEEIENDSNLTEEEKDIKKKALRKEMGLGKGKRNKGEAKRKKMKSGISKDLSPEQKEKANNRLSKVEKRLEKRKAAGEISEEQYLEKLEELKKMKGNIEK